MEIKNITYVNRQHYMTSAIRVETDTRDVLNKFVVLRLVSHSKDHIEEQFLRKLTDTRLLRHLAYQT